MNINRFVLKLLIFAVAFTMLAGCGSIDFSRKFEFGSNWVSREGKTREQFEKDQADCKRGIMVTSPPPFSSQSGMGSGSGSWDMSDIREFENCMRAKGWDKE